MQYEAKILPDCSIVSSVINGHRTRPISGSEQAGDVGSGWLRGLERGYQLVRISNVVRIILIVCSFINYTDFMFFLFESQLLSWQLADHSVAVKYGM